jgi:hypothetical protein
MSSFLPDPSLDSDPEIAGRLSRLEHQHKRLFETQTEMLAEIRSLKQDIGSYAKAISEEMTRLYKVILEAKKT